MRKTTYALIFFSLFFYSVKAQFTQNFDSGSSLPAGWSVINGGDINTWGFGAPLDALAYNGNNVAKITYNSSVAHNDYLVTPQITVVAGVNDRLTFRVRNYSVSYVEHFDVKLSTTTPTSAANFTTTLLGDTAAPSTWTKMTIDLTSYIGQSIYVGFHATSLDKWELYLDNIVNDTPIVCNASAPTISSVIQPTCTASGSVTLGGLPSVGTWNLNTTYYSSGSPITTITTGTGTSVTIPVANENYNSRMYSFYFTDDNGCQSPISQVYIDKKYDFSPSFLGEYQDTNNDGITNLGDQILYHIVLNNFGACDVGNSDITLLSGPSYSISSPLGIFNFPGNSTQNLNVLYNITQNDIDNGYVDCGLQILPQGVGYGFSIEILPAINPLNTNGIRLNAFIDSNNNGTKEASEPLFAFGDFHYTKNGGIPVVINSSNGSYLIPEWNPSNLYSISLEVNPLFSNYLSSSASFSGINCAAGTGITDYYFPVTYINSEGDLQINVIPIGGAPRPGFAYKNRIAYLNSFSYPISGNLFFTNDNAVTITSVSQSGVVNNANGFSSTFYLQPYEIRYIDVDMLVSPTAVLGNALTNSASITIPANDIYTANNNSSLTQTIVNSYDPNNKTETHGGKILFSTFSSNDYLTYTVNFENTGTANAINVQVADNLDFRLDENSIIMVSSSHNCILEKSGSFLRWNFNGIQLPPLGKGFITFKIKPKPGYAPGTIIPNTANIYFDSNPAITTTLCTTEFVSFLNIEDFAFSGLHYFPNPVKNILSISNSSIITQVEITSVLGQKMTTQNCNGLQAEINLSHLAEGIYLVKVKTENKEKTFRILKQ